MIIENCADYYGFLNGMDIVTAGKITEALRSESKDVINDIRVSSEVVEEVIRRDGEFLTGKEAQPIAPCEITYTDVFFARYKYLDGEPRPVNPDFAEYDWITLSIPQYMYGAYLQRCIDEGKLKKDDFYR